MKLTSEDFNSRIKHTEKCRNVKQKTHIFRRKKIISALSGATLLFSIFPLTAQADDIATQSDEILVKSALDPRRADNGTTPIAVELSGNVYGARISPYPDSADESAITKTAYYVDCNLKQNGQGTKAAPFNTLEAINKVSLTAGDAVLFKGGSACTGTFKPNGSGTAENPIIINAYDSNTENRARINANGADEAILVENNQHYVIRNLELTNTANDDTDYTEIRHGLRIINRDAGTLSGFNIANLYVHDVLGNNQKNSAGIRLEVLGKNVKSKFSKVEIAYNELRHVNRTGIVAATDWWQREEAEYWGGTFYAQDPMHIHDNFLTDIGGDGIVVWAAPDSIIEYNTLENAANEHGGKSDNSHNAGIWSWVTDRIIFRNNHIFDMHRAADNNDGAAFDADTGGTGQVFEHNLTHDNAGGFIMYCGCWGLSTNITARYNISINDGRFVDLDPVAEPSGETARTIFMAGSTDSHFYNNTVLLPPTAVNLAGYGNYMVNNLAIVNNLFIAQNGTKVSDTTTGNGDNTLTWRNNIYAGPTTGWPSVGTGNQVLPNLSLASSTGLAKLQIRDDALLAAGYPVADPYRETQVKDFIGNLVPTVTAPDIGAFQYSPLPAQVTISDGGFEECESTDWGDIERVSPGRTGSYALQVNANAVRREVPAAINRTYRVFAAVKGETDPQIRIVLPSGAGMNLEPFLNAAGEKVRDNDGYTPVSGVFRTSADATSFTLEISGSGLVDDISAVGVDDLMIDGSFEAPANTVWQPAISQQGWPANSGENGPIDRSTDAVSGKYAAPVPATGMRLIDDKGKQAPFSGDAYNRFTYLTPGQDYELGVWAKAKDQGNISLAWEPFSGWRADYPLTLTNIQGSISTDAEVYTRLSLPVKAAQEQIVVACQGNGLCDDMTLVAAWDGTIPEIAANSQCPPAAAGSGTDIPQNDGSESSNEPDLEIQDKPAPKQDQARSTDSGNLAQTGSMLSINILFAMLLSLFGAAGISLTAVKRS